MNSISRPSSSSDQLRSAVRTGARSRRARARHDRSPSERPCVRVDRRSRKSRTTQANSQGLTPIVVPYRVQGFGPYEGVLSELDYRAHRLGLLPHPNVGLWIARQASLMKAEALDRRHLTLVANLQ